MSTTGRRPAMAAPTPTPVNPASEIGVSTMRSAPNSSTRPERTLNGVPASATSSPKMQTRESRRISSASASRTACANVSSRSGIDILLDLIDARIRRCDGKLHGGFHFSSRFSGNLFQSRSLRLAQSQQPVCMQLDRIAVGLPVLFFLLGAIVLAIDVPHVMAAVAVRIRLQECWAAAGARTLHQSRCDFIHCSHILPIDLRGLEAEGPGAPKNCARSGFAEVRVLVVHIIFAD